MEKDYILVEFGLKGKRLVQKVELGVDAGEEDQPTKPISFGEGWEMVKQQVLQDMFPKVIEELRK